MVFPFVIGDNAVMKNDCLEFAWLAVQVAIPSRKGRVIFALYLLLLAVIVARVAWLILAQ